MYSSSSLSKSEPISIFADADLKTSLGGSDLSRPYGGVVTSIAFPSLCRRASRVEASLRKPPAEHEPLRTGLEYIQGMGVSSPLKRRTEPLAEQVHIHAYWQRQQYLLVLWVCYSENATSRKNPPIDYLIKTFISLQSVRTLSRPPTDRLCVRLQCESLVFLPYSLKGGTETAYRKALSSFRRHDR